MEFSRKAYWSGLPCPPPGDLPNLGNEPTSLMSPALAGRFLTTSVTWKIQHSPVTAEKTSGQQCGGRDGKGWIKDPHISLACFAWLFVPCCHELLERRKYKENIPADLSYEYECMLHRLALCCLSNEQVKAPSGQERAPDADAKLCGWERSSAPVLCLSKCLLSLHTGYFRFTDIMLISQKPNGNTWKEKAFIKLKKRSEFNDISRNFPGSPLAKTPCSQCTGPRFEATHCN